MYGCLQRVPDVSLYVVKSAEMTSYELRIANWTWYGAKTRLTMDEEFRMAFCAF
jgi:hypothetical protein